ncbi:MAG: hypothetical protein ABSC94_10585 [Polyangiaceae bacterium]
MGAIPRLRGELDATLFQDERVAGPAARSGTFSLRTFDAGGCRVAQAGGFELSPCASLEVAWLSAKGLYEAHPSPPGYATWLALRARATVAYPASAAWAVRADLGGGLNLSRPEFLSRGPEGGLIDQPARFTGRGALGFELHF